MMLFVMLQYNAITTIEQKIVFIVCLFVGVYRPTREFLTNLETSPLPVKGYAF